jgi:hypothetical protein
MFVNGTGSKGNKQAGGGSSQNFILFYFIFIVFM